jgi:outer membrane lipoprotein-sorting protein
MKQGIRASLAVCVLFVAFSGAWAWQMTPQPFSADMSTTAKGEKSTGKFYFSPPKSRVDMSSRGRDVSYITDGKTQTSQILMHQQHTYMEVHGNQASPMAPSMPRVDTAIDPNNPCSARTDVTCKKSGPETVNGRVCDKWVFTDKNVTTSWIDQKLHFPIKTQNSDGTVVEFSNIKEGAPPPSVFEVPAGYQKFVMPAMGGRMPQ